MKRTLSLLTLLCVIFNYTISVSASNTISVAENNAGISIQMDATDKMQFAQNMISVYENDKENNNILEPSIEKINELLLQIPLVDEEEKETINAELAQYGVYEYINSYETETASTYAVSPDAGDVTLAIPTIYYQAWEDSWTITCGGSWNNYSWYTGTLGDIGGADAFGVFFTNTGGTYQSSVIRSSGYLSDSSSETHNPATNFVDGIGSNGFGFRLQDYAYSTAIPFVYEYVGCQWSGICTYDARFSYYNGIATAYYIHTYNDSSISNITLNSTGLNYTPTGSDYFHSYSAQKTFGVYNW